EVAVIEDEDELAAVLTQALNRVRNPARKEPQVAFAHVFNKRAALVIDRGNARRARGHEGPLRTHMPMQLPHAAADQPHLHPCHLLCDRQFAHGHLARPSAGLDSAPRKRKRIFKRWLSARIRLGRKHRIGLRGFCGSITRRESLLVHRRLLRGNGWRNRRGSQCSRRQECAPAEGIARGLIWHLSTSSVGAGPYVRALRGEQDLGRATRPTWRRGNSQFWD